MSNKTSCIQSVGNTVDSSISGFFLMVGRKVAARPRLAILLSFILASALGAGIINMNTESRGEKLFVPQDNEAQDAAETYEDYFPSLSRFAQILVEAKGGSNVLTKESLVEAMKMHQDIAAGTSMTDGQEYNLVQLCTKGGRTCVDPSVNNECVCQISSIFRQWNYDLATLEADQDFLATLSAYGSQEDLDAIVSQAVYDDDGQVLSAKAFSISYFLVDRSMVKDGDEEDPINEDWEEKVFLEVVEDHETEYPSLDLNWFTGRSREDDAQSAISGDLALVQISYIAVFVFLGATLGKFCPGLNSRWTMALAGVALVGLCTVAGIGLSAFFGLDYTPLHSLLPFILLGIGVDDAFVIANAFDQERKGVPRSSETNEALLRRAARALARAGASITVTSMTDLVAFAISASSQLPALSSFSVYASVSIVFLWFFAAVFFTSCMIIDERRQNENRRDCLCCISRKTPLEELEGKGSDGAEGVLPAYFRKYHTKFILSHYGKIFVLVLLGALFGVSSWWASQLTVEDTSRDFIPSGTSLSNYFEAADELFPSQGIDLYMVFENQPSNQIYENRAALSTLRERVEGKSTRPPYIAEPTSEEAFRNVMEGLYAYLASQGSEDIGGVPLNEDGWPTTAQDFADTLYNYTQPGQPGSRFSRDVSFDENTESGSWNLRAITVQSEYVRLIKEASDGRVIDDADKQIEAMDSTREMMAGWTDLQPNFAHSEQFATIEGFKVIGNEFLRNILLALGSVAVIVLLTVASPLTAFFITLAVFVSIVNILGFMYLMGIVIDSVAVVMMTLAVGLSVDYAAHIGHCFMTKQGKDRDQRVSEALQDVGSAVLNGAFTTFLAVIVLLFSSTYVFWVLSRIFMLTVVFGVLNGVVLLPVLLSLWGPPAFSGDHHSSDKPEEDEKDDADMENANRQTIPMDSEPQSTEKNGDLEGRRLEDEEV